MNICQSHTTAVEAFLADAHEEENGRYEQLLDAIHSGDTLQKIQSYMKGISPNRRYDGFTEALDIAIDRRRPRVVRLLLQKGASPNLSHANGNLPLIQAIEIHSLPIVEALLEHNADVDCRSAAGETALELAERLANETQDGGERRIFEALSEAEAASKSCSCVIS